MKTQAPVEAWTPQHVGASAVFGLSGVGPPVSMLLAVGYELAEQVVERTETGLRVFATSGPEGAIHIDVDLVAFAAGYDEGRLARHALLR